MNLWESTGNEKNKVEMKGVIFLFNMQIETNCPLLDEQKSKLLLNLKNPPFS